MKRARALLPIAAYLLVVGMSAYGHWRIAVDATHDEAARCVTAWEARADIRDMAEKSYRRNAETLVALSTSANPDRVAAYLEQVERDVDEIRSTLPDPDCDLDTARERLR